MFFVYYIEQRNGKQKERPHASKKHLYKMNDQGLKSFSKTTQT